ncbi:MFS transporter [Phycicoccus sp.]|uniref:MFS transporter n=1 Tax=Phycicoccus sp. TaxID=1902410 RepID=UPI002BA71471|nr:MFS transporter [Phycicoccus sp.]HMM95907.1 MFS transporter [Phycicoccus sp.]
MTTVTLAPYRRVLSRPSLRRTLVLGSVSRVAMFGTPVIVALHVVTTLGQGYARAGLVGAFVTIAIAVGGPWRGRLLDRHGLRAVVGPSVLVSGACWLTAPFVGYWALVALATVAGIFVVPVSSILRQAVVAAVPAEDRRTALSLDSAVMELTFMVAPALAVWWAAQGSTTWVLFSVQAFGLGAGLLLWLVDPPLRHDSDPDHPHDAHRSRWLRGPFLGVIAMVVATAVILAGSDLGFVATSRDLGAVRSLSLVIVLWGLGSLVGGLAYGALSREVPARWLLLALALVTAPMAFVTTVHQLAALALLAGLLCAPTITATVDEALQLVPPDARGEAMGWHASALTAGGAVGAPLAGFVADHQGGPSGFLAVAAVGAAVVLVVVALRPRRRPPSPAEALREAQSAPR